MPTPLKREPKTERVVVRSHPALVARMNQVANERFGGDRSDLIRTAVADYLDRIEAEQDEREAA